MSNNENGSFMERGIYAGNPDQHWGWLFIPDTPQAREEAIGKGYNAFTTYAFEFEFTPENIKKYGRLPNKYGDLWMDIDSKEAPEAAIESIRFFLSLCQTDVPGFDLKMLRYFISGSKGCHICMPAKMFGGEEGDPNLPAIHYSFILGLSSYIRFTPMTDSTHILSYIDKNLYKGGKGQLMREKNILRPDGNYKVEVTTEQFFGMEARDLLEMVHQPSFIEIVPVEPVQTGLTKLYRKTYTHRKLLEYNGYNGKFLDCEFITHCLYNSEKVTEPQWFLLLRFLKQFGNVRNELAHEFSMEYRDYDKNDTERKFEHAIKYAVPTCNEVRQHFECPKDCKCPSLQLDKSNSTKRKKEMARYKVLDDGLYYSKSGCDEDFVKICSRIEVIGRSKSPEGGEWGRVIEITDPENNVKPLIIPMKDCMGKGDPILQLLGSAGVEVTPHATPKVILDYIRTADTDKTIIQTHTLGWYGNLYILPEKAYGSEQNYSVKFEGSSNLFGISGTFEEWQENVAAKCVGNSLAMFTIAYALTGPLLTPCGIEGSGLHLYANSSSGKTTLALVAGSVCGGSNSRGFIRQWRATANSLERIAMQHNDNLLVLDEIGQATPETVYEVIYMLTNGQGRSRLNSDSTLRSIATWTLNYLSTGEVQVSEKIDESFKKRAMAGQDVRAISVPLDQGKGINVFTVLHGFEDPATLSNYLKEAAKKYYGTCLRKFIIVLSGSGSVELDENIQYIRKLVKEFTDSHTKSTDSGQVKRVAEKFGLVYATGAFAAEHGVLPWSPEDSKRVATEWFEIWLEQRGGRGNLEVEKAISNVMAFIEKYAEYRFFPVSSNEYQKNDKFAGYKWTDPNKSATIYFFIPRILREIVGTANFKEVIRKLKEDNHILLKSSGEIMDTKTIGEKTRRGIGIIIPDPKEDKSPNYHMENGQIIIRSEVEF